LIAENAREQLAKERQCREELQKMMNHFNANWQNQKASEEDQEQQVQNSSALDRYER